MGNKITQIYVRTGQPGVAPERAVIDRYDITGYLSKVEATEDKLYSLVRAGIRTALVTGLSLGLSEATAALINASRSREQMAAVLTYFVASLQRDPHGEPLQNVDIRMCCISDGQVIGGDWNEDDADALAVRDRLAAQPGTPVGTQRRHVRDRRQRLPDPGGRRPGDRRHGAAGARHGARARDRAAVAGAVHALACRAVAERRHARAELVSA